MDLVRNRNLIVEFYSAFESTVSMEVDQSNRNATFPCEPFILFVTPFIV
jgi:hypothetical protein